MDILKEIVSLVLESYFGWSEYEITELWRAYPGRRRSIVRQIGSSLPDILPKILTKRSIVREIGSRLPLPPVKRPCFKIGSNAYCNPDSTNLQDGEVNWILGPEYYEDSFSSIGSEGDTSDRLLCEDFDEVDNCEPKQTDILNTLPSSTTPEPITDNNMAMKKISALEEELNRLRAQIASIVVPPPSTPSMPNVFPMTSTPCTPVAPPPPPPLMFAPPPPPPPPPPPSLCLTPVKSVQDVVKENRAQRKTLSGIPANKPSNVPCLSEVLKGLGSVKLKSIERSPGGTPLRTKPLETEGTDASSIIAKALKKKFAQRRKLRDADSPSLDKENMSSFSPSPAKSPKTPKFAPHLGRKPGSDLNDRVLQTIPLVNMNA